MPYRDLSAVGSGVSGPPQAPFPIPSARTPVLLAPRSVANVPERLHALRRENDLARRQLGALADRLDRIAWALESLERILLGREPPRKPIRGTPFRTLKPDAMIQDFQSTPRSDGSTDFLLGGFRKLNLSPLLADLLCLLASQGRPSGDHLVGWKTAEELIASLSKKAGRRISHGALLQLVYRLRKALWKAGLEGDLVRFNLRRGWRLALQCKPPPASGIAL